MGPHWSKEEMSYIKRYGELSKEDLIRLIPNRTWAKIRYKLWSVGISKEIHWHNKLYKLLEENPISYYWLGFLMADGHFSKKGWIYLSLANLDAPHVQKFSDYIEGPKICLLQKKSQSRCTVKNKDVVKQLSEKFNISNRKTYEPCNIKGIKDDKLFLAWLIGFIDGDGTIVQRRSNSQYIKIAVHSSWTDNLDYIYKRVQSISRIRCHPPSLDGRGYIHIRFGRIELLQYLKKFAIENNLPILTRKWDKIDLNKKLPMKYFMKQLRNSGKNAKEIAETLNISVRLVYASIRMYDFDPNIY